MKHFTLEVSGSMACFTRPEMKVERVSYEVITPSAARSIFEAIYWKPPVRWHIERIEVLNPISFAQIRRCEVSSLAHVKKSHIIANEHRQLRSSMVLRDVCYRLSARMEVLTFLLNEGETEQKYWSIFERRALKGQCFAQPYLGCREFAADWRLVDTALPLSLPISESRELGLMLHDIDFTDSDHPQPRFFEAVMCEGVINVSAL